MLGLGLSVWLRIAAVAGAIGLLVGAYFYIDHRGYQRGWNDRDREILEERLVGWETAFDDARATLEELADGSLADLRAETRARAETASQQASLLEDFDARLDALKLEADDAVFCDASGNAVVDPDFARLWNDAAAAAAAIPGAGDPGGGTEGRRGDRDSAVRLPD